MTIKDMHYDFKKKLNKVDSQQNRNLLIPEIDWALNEACEIFVKIVAQPRLASYFGVEKSQRNIDDIRNVIVSDDTSAVITNNSATLPSNYLFYLSGKVKMSKGTCVGIYSHKLHIRQHDDDFENSYFDKSSFEWRSVNALFANNKLKFFTDGTFTITELSLSYIKKLTYMHNAGDFRGGSYALPSGTVLTGSVNCELPDQTHREIVDIAVLLVSGELNLPEYQTNLNKLKLNNLN